MVGVWTLFAGKVGIEITLQQVGHVMQFEPLSPSASSAFMVDHQVFIADAPKQSDVLQ